MSQTHDILYEQLSSIVGSDYVSDDVNIRTSYAYDKGTDSLIDPGLPRLVVRPGTVEEIVEIVRAANRTKTPIRIRGGGGALGGTYLQRGCILLDLTRMNEVVEIDEDSMSVTAECGITWGKLIYELKKKGWRTAIPGPTSGAGATVGGGISQVAFWYGMAKYGNTADTVLCLEVVLPTGDVIWTGSKAMPGAKGYSRYGSSPDTTGLFIGDNGIMGIKTKATLRMIPWPDVVEYISFGYDDLESITKAAWMVARTHTASDVMCMGPYLNEAFAPLQKSLSGVQWSLNAAIEGEKGAEKVVEAQREYLAGIAKQAGGRELPGAEFIRWHNTRIYEWTPRTGPKGQAFTACCYTLPIPHIPEDYKAWLKAVEPYVEEAKKHKVDFIFTAFANKFPAAANVIPYIQWFDDDVEAREIAHKIWLSVMELTSAKLGGVHHWTSGRIGEINSKYWSPEYYQFLRALKRAIDPNGIINPGEWRLPE